MRIISAGIGFATNVRVAMARVIRTICITLAIEEHFDFFRMDGFYVSIHGPHFNEFNIADRTFKYLFPWPSMNSLDVLQAGLAVASLEGTAGTSKGFLPRVDAFMINYPGFNRAGVVAKAALVF